MKPKYKFTYRNHRIEIYELLEDDNRKWYYEIEGIDGQKVASPKGGTYAVCPETCVKLFINGMARRRVRVEEIYVSGRGRLI